MLDQLSIAARELIFLDASMRPILINNQYNQKY